MFEDSQNDILLEVLKRNENMTSGEQVSESNETLETLESSARHVFETACDIELGAAQPVQSRNEFSGVIAISGSMSMTIVINLSLDLVTSVAESLLGLEADDVDQETAKDIVCELANMVGGTTKERFGNSLSLGLPTVVIGPDHVVDFGAGVSVQEIQLGDGPRSIVLEVGVKSFD